MSKNIPNIENPDPSSEKMLDPISEKNYGPKSGSEDPKFSFGMVQICNTEYKMKTPIKKIEYLKAI